MAAQTGPLLAGGAACTLYCWTLAPSVGFVDSGELTVAVWGLGVPHPPGFPLYVVLAHLIALLPIGSVAARVNFASALFGTFATITVFLLTRALIDSTTRSTSSPLPPSTRARRKSPAPSSVVSESEAADSFSPAVLAGASTAALLFAALRTMWSFATVAEVYTLSTWLVVLVWLLMWRGRINIAALVFGLAVGVHPAIAVVMLPALAVLVYRREGIGFFASARLAIVAFVASAGAGVYLYLPLAAMQSPALNWGDPQTVGRFWAHISGWQYRAVVEVSSSALGEALARFGQMLVQQFSNGTVPLGLVLAAGGLVYVFRQNRTIFWVLTSWVATNILLTTWLNAGWTSDIPRGGAATEDLEAYYLPTFTACAILAGLGAAWLVHYVARRRSHTFAWRPAIVILLAAAVIQPVAGNWHVNNRRADVVARNFVGDVLASIAPGGLLLMRDWQLSSPMMYVLAVEKDRDDVVAVDLNLLERSWYVASLSRAHPGLFDRSQAERATFLEQLSAWEQNPTRVQRDEGRRQALAVAFDNLVLSSVVVHLRAGRAYVTREVALALDGKGHALAQLMRARFQLVPQGLVFELRTEAQFFEPVPLSLRVAPLLAMTRRLGPDHLVSQRVAPTYRDMLVNRALYLEANNRCNQATDAFAAALEIDSAPAAVSAAMARCRERGKGHTEAPGSRR